MRYWEGDFYSGFMLSCYLDPIYHPGCLGCTDRKDCYSSREYELFKPKALALSEFLDDRDSIPPEDAPRLAWMLKAVHLEGAIREILSSKSCIDGKLSSILKLVVQDEVRKTVKSATVRQLA